MKVLHDSSLAAVVAFFGGVYPFMLLGDALEWPRGVQAAIGLIGLATLAGVKLAVMRRERRRARDDRDGASGGRRCTSAAP